MQPRVASLVAAYPELDADVFVPYLSDLLLENAGRLPAAARDEARVLLGVSLPPHAADALRAALVGESTAACGGSESELPSDAIDEDAEGIDSPVAIDSALALCDRPGLLFCEDFEFVQSPVGPPRSTRSGRCGFRRATASA